jgi:hypothetical protein
MVVSEVMAHVPGCKILVVSVEGNTVPRLKTPAPIKHDCPSGAFIGPGMVRVTPASIVK